mgnify:CR=1 FL=1
MKKQVFSKKIYAVLLSTVGVAMYAQENVKESTIEEVVVTTGRTKPRTVITSAIPIDNISSAQLKSTGQVSFDKALMFAVPSFNSSQQTVSDATAHFDPADLRGLGPSRTLVLVNGKRKNQSALIYVNDTPGKGEVGTDLKSIPSAALQNVEVLRDGASAQYGSDAIAGVINIILKNSVGKSAVNVFSGITSKGDGFNIGADFNTGIRVAKKGSLNLTLGFSSQNKTNRAGTTTKDELFGVDNAWTQANPGLGMIVGQPKTKVANIFVNFELPTGATGKFYTFGGTTYRTGVSYALYRTPYWVTSDFGLLTPQGQSYNGFQPEFKTDVYDHNLTSGWKGMFGKWNFDGSATFGSNAVNYVVQNTINRSLGANSQTSFKAGGHKFSNIIGNLDINRDFGNLVLGAGLEARNENYKAIAGEETSYTGSGAESFPGLQPQNEVNKNRQNIGAYVNTEWDVTNNLLLGGTVRYENFSDFGNNVSWKGNARYKLLDDKLVFRGSVSTGFRAPSLHQIYYSNVQTKITGNAVANQGTFNNDSQIVRSDLGVAKLNAEHAFNITGGFALKPVKNLTITADYYRIKIKDRVLFSGDIGYKTGGPGTPDATNPVEVILNNNNITSLKFFTNAVNTVTNGVDFVVNYNTPAIGKGKLGIMAAFNYNETKIVDNIAVPSILAENGYAENFFDRKEQSRITSARPKTKTILGLSYDMPKFNFNLNNTYFGQVVWQHASDVSKDQTFSGKVITDIVLTYKITGDLKVSGVVNNLFNIYPDALDNKGDVVTDLGGRFRYPWEVNQFGFNGTTFQLNVNYTF